MKKPYRVLQDTNTVPDTWIIQGPTKLAHLAWDNFTEAGLTCELLNEAHAAGLREGAQGIEAAPRSAKREEYSGEPGPTKEDAPKNNGEQSEDAALPDGRWIPVSERLPELNEKVLVIEKYGREAWIASRGQVWDKAPKQIIPGEWRWYAEAPDAGEVRGDAFWDGRITKNSGIEITHWMPLPTPPTI